MTTSVLTNQLKKQPGKARKSALPAERCNSCGTHADSEETRRLEQAANGLEQCVLGVLEAEAGAVYNDPEALHFERQLKNIATSVSLALGEYRGPQRFHNHFRHDPNHYEIMHPVFEPALQTLVHACEEALAQCDRMVGVRDRGIARLRGGLEQCLRSFLHRYEETLW